MCIAGPKLNRERRQHTESSRWPVGSGRDVGGAAAALQAVAECPSGELGKAIAAAAK